MLQKTLNHLILLHMYEESTTDLDLNLIANDFILKKSRRVQFFGKQVFFVVIMIRKLSF